MKLTLVCVLDLIFLEGGRHLNLFESKLKKKKKTNGTAWKITVV